MEDREIIVIGAGPAGSIASSLLKRAGHDVVVLERESFPRFSIGESLLPHCLDLVAEAGMIGAIDAAGFQLKNGAAFARGDYYADFDFGQQYSRGRATAFQVPRARFDQLLADEAERQGVEIRYRTGIAAVDFSSARPAVTTRDAAGNAATLRADFVLDASGFGRCLARQLELERPSPFPVRQALFTHLADGIPRGSFDRQKIRIVVHPRHREVWFWLIPFSGGRSSLGVVATPEFLAGFGGTPEARLRALVAEDGGLAGLLGWAVFFGDGSGDGAVPGLGSAAVALAAASLALGLVGLVSLPRLDRAGRIALAAATALVALGRIDPRVVVLDADVGNSTYSNKFEAEFPERFYQFFIAEQAMVGAAMGLAARGAIPFPSTFACFLTRASDFIRMAGISNLNVKLAQVKGKWLVADISAQ